LCERNLIAEAPELVEAAALERFGSVAIEVVSTEFAVSGCFCHLKLYLELKTLRPVREELDRRSIVSKQWVSKGSIRHGGYPFGRGALYHLLANSIYLGEIRHKSLSYPGQHEAIIERAT
jgi:hypothetical protein